MKTALVVIALVVAIAAPTVSIAGSVFVPGEKLEYRVSYLNITLGTIKTEAVGYKEVDGKKYPIIRVFIDSHPNIPFVSLHSIYKSRMNQDLTYSYHFEATTQQEDGSWIFDQYIFDYKKRSITMETYEKKVKTASKEVPIKKRFNDGSSLLFAARSFLHSGKTYKMPTVIMEETVNTIVAFNGKQEEIEIDAVDYPIKSVHLNGDAQWTGVYGLTGRFEGWFSDDEASIPLKAHMSLYVGSATIELVKWTRPGWSPPKAQ